jgi:hypothetical protein
MKARIVKPALFLMLGIFLGMYFLRCGNDAGIGSDFDPSRYYTKDQIDSLFYTMDQIDSLCYTKDEMRSLLSSVDDANINRVSGEILNDYQGTVRELYLKDLQSLQDCIKLKTGKSTISLTDVTGTVLRLELKCETYDDTDFSMAVFQRFRFARVNGNPAEDIDGIYWPIMISDINNTEDGTSTYKLIYVTAILK